MTTDQLPGFTSQQTSDGLYRFFIRDMKPASVDAWFDMLMTLQAEVFAANGHMRVLYTLYGVWPTPYTIKKVLEASRNAPENLKSSSAILLVEANGVTVRILQSMFRQMPVYASQSRQIFFDESDALRWLDERHAAFTPQSLSSADLNDPL